MILLMRTMIIMLMLASPAIAQRADSTDPLLAIPECEWLTACSGPQYANMMSEICKRPLDICMAAISKPPASQPDIAQQFAEVKWECMRASAAPQWSGGVNPYWFDACMEAKGWRKGTDKKWYK